MALNLIRNSRVFFTTNLDAADGYKVKAAGAATTDTFEIQVLDGFSISQNTNSETVTVSEAGDKPTRGQRSFNTSLAPVDFSFSTYMRPSLVSNEVKCEESVLWNALLGSELTSTAVGTITGTLTAPTYAQATGVLSINGSTIAATNLAVGDFVVIGGITSADTTGVDVVNFNAPARVTAVGASAITLQLHNPPAAAAVGLLATTTSTLKFYKSAWAPVLSAAAGSNPAAFSLASTHTSNDNTLVRFGLVVIIDSVTYFVDNCALNQATVDFGLDGIATIQWTGQATTMRQATSNVTTATAGTFGGGLGGSYTQKVTSAGYITNKLSTVALKNVKALSNAAASTNIAAGTQYLVALTGGSLTINNNITYITPSNLGVVNTPVAYFTGTRAISGTLNAYLNTGTLSGTIAKGTGALLKDMLDTADNTIEPMFTLTLSIGGSGNKMRVDVEMPTTSIALPSIGTEQVVTAAINFTAQSTGDNVGSAKSFDVGGTNELFIRYFHS